MGFHMRYVVGLVLNKIGWELEVELYMGIIMGWNLVRWTRVTGN